MTSDPTRAKPVRVTNKIQACLLVGFGLLGPVVGLLILEAGNGIHDGEAWAFAIPFIAAGLLLAWRAARVGVIATEEGVRILNVWRSRSILWADVADFQVGPTPVTWTVWVHHRDGRRFEAMATTAYRRSKADRYREQLSRLRPER